MNTTVVPAPAVQAKRPVRSDKPAIRKDEQKVVNEDEERAAQDDSEKQVSVASASEGMASEANSETSLAGGFTFGTALADAAATAGSLTSEAEGADKAGFSQFGEDGGSTILLVGAIALVGLGVLVLAGGGGGNKNEAPTITGGDAVKEVTTNEDTPIKITIAATDPDSDALTFTAAGATKGTVSVGANGELTYTPNANANGSDTFTVTVRDPDGLTDTQTVKVNITPVDDVVSFSADAATAAATEDTVFNGSLSSLIVDPDGDGVLSVQTQGAHGKVVVNANGTYSYTPNANYAGTDSFVVKIANGAAANAVSDTIVVNVTVANVNDVPVQAAPTTTELTVVKGGSGQFIIDFDDADGDVLTASSSTPAHGTINPQTNTYTPNAGFVGADTFNVTVSDGKGGNVTYAVSVNVVDTLPVTEVLIDNLAGTITVDGAGGAIVFTDDVTVRTDVIIKNFGSDDVIEIDGIASQSNYFYTASNVAGGAADDLVITYNSGGNFTQIVLVDAAINADGGSNFVFSYDSAVASLGFDFITIV